MQNDGVLSTCLKNAPNISFYVVQKLVFYSVLVQCTIMYCIVLSLCTHLRRSENPIWHDEQEHDSNYEKGSIWVKMRIAQHHSNIRFTFRGKKVRFFFTKNSAVVALLKEKKFMIRKHLRKICIRKQRPKIRTLYLKHYIFS